MSINSKYAVFGLGKFGSAIAVELARNGAEVLAVDKDPAPVDMIAPFVNLARCADVTAPQVIKKLGIGDFDTVVVCMAQNLEASVLATALCKEAGVKNVVVKCLDDMHKRIIERVGADSVVFPEKESGVRLAKNLLSSGFVDMMDISENVSIVELPVKAEWVGKTLADLDLRKKYSINVVAVRQNEEITISTDPLKPIEEGTKFVVVANTEKLQKLK